MKEFVTFVNIRESEVCNIRENIRDNCSDTSGMSSSQIKIILNSIMGDFIHVGRISETTLISPSQSESSRRKIKTIFNFMLKSEESQEIHEKSFCSDPTSPPKKLRRKLVGLKLMGRIVKFSHANVRPMLVVYQTS